MMSEVRWKRKRISNETPRDKLNNIKCMEVQSLVGQITEISKTQY